jgi:transposase-like protein
MTKKRKRYTPAERTRILAAAEKQELNGVQAAKKFGISTLTYYTWKKKANETAARGPRSLTVSDGTLDGLLRSRLRNRLQQLLPVVLREEVDAAVSRALGTNARRGRRKA